MGIPQDLRFAVRALTRRREANAEVVLTAVAVRATLLPTRRAVNVDPAHVFRHE